MLAVLSNYLLLCQIKESKNGTNVYAEINNVSVTMYKICLFSSLVRG